MIVGIINGYYRSGTTIFQRFVELCEPSFIVLCEPTQHEIIYHIMANGWNNVHPLHGFEIFKGYSKLPRNVLRDFIDNFIYVFGYTRYNHGIFTDPDEAITLLEPFHECDEKIVIKSTQLSLVLDEVVDEFDCWAIHLERPIENTVWNHFGNAVAFFEFVESDDAPIPFYGDLVYERIVKKFDFELKPRKPIEKLVFNVKFVNDYVKPLAEKIDEITIINFDEFVTNPSDYVDNLPFDASLKIHREVFDPEKLNPAPELARKIVHDILKSLKY